MNGWELLEQGFWAFVATFGFGVLFNAPSRVLIYCGLTGAAGHICRRALLMQGVHPVTATFCGALVVGLLGYIEARHFRMPRLIFTVTGIIPMVPGVPAFETVVYFMRDDILTGIETAVQVALLVGAIGAGLMTARLVLGLRRSTAHTRRDRWTRGLDPSD
jgi:uncharacterized membrane protein YjjB (DUF3815 family)